MKKRIIVTALAFIMILSTAVTSFAADMSPEEAAAAAKAEQQKMIERNLALQGVTLNGTNHGPFDLKNGTLNIIFTGENGLIMPSENVEFHADNVSATRQLSYGPRADNKQFMSTQSYFNVSAKDAAFITKVTLKILGKAISIHDKYSDHGSFYEVTATGQGSSEMYITMKDGEAVQDLNFHFENVGLDIPLLMYISVEYKEDPLYLLTTQRNETAKKVADVEKTIKAKNADIQKIEAEIARCEAEIAQYKAEIDELERQIAALTPQGMANNTASVLSEGNPVVVVGIACFAVVFLLAMILFRKKRAHTPAQSGARPEESAAAVTEESAEL